ncbi:hypothetical protein BYT27DRAFT_7207645 [Phlegmacium glaucopus]|nr:hypothetical protein BYT27DRAFT_7207645 [Phlegmacium glaucopus]
MKFAAIHTIFFVLASVSAIIAGSIPNSSWKRHEDDKRIVTTDESHTSLRVDARQVQPVVPTAIGVAQLVIAITAWITQLVQGQTENAQPDPNLPLTGVQLLQACVSQIETNNILSGSPFKTMATSSLAPITSVNWDGVAGQDWGLNTINVTATEGMSTWLSFWFKTGSITIQTLNPTNDIAIGHASSSSVDPRDPSLLTYYFT